MLSVARLVLHALPEPCLLYGGAVRDWALRGEKANDLDVVIFPQRRRAGHLRPEAGEGPAVHPASPDRAVAEARRQAHSLPCVESLIAHAAQLPLPLEVSSRCEGPPNGSSNLDFLEIVVLRPRDPAAARELGDVQVELCLSGAYAAGEVDADVNNLSVGGGVGLLPRDAHVPFSPPHAIRHCLAKQFAYVRQAGMKLGIRRLWKLFWRGWTRVATIPWTHPAAQGGNGQAAEALAGTAAAAAAGEAADPEKREDPSGSNHARQQAASSQPLAKYKVPPWAVCPAARLEMGV